MTITRQITTEHLFEIAVLYLDVTASVDRDRLSGYEYSVAFPELDEEHNRYYFCKLDPTACHPSTRIR